MLQLKLHKRRSQVKQKRVSFVLTFCLMIGLLSGIGVIRQAEAETDVWDGTVPDSFSDTTHTGSSESDAIEIRSAQDLAYLAKIVRNTENVSKGKYYILTKDIDLNGLKADGTVHAVCEWKRAIGDIDVYYQDGMDMQRKSG